MAGLEPGNHWDVKYCLISRHTCIFCLLAGRLCIASRVHACVHCQQSNTMHVMWLPVDFRTSSCVKRCIRQPFCSSWVTFWAEWDVRPAQDACGRCHQHAAELSEAGSGHAQQQQHSSSQQNARTAVQGARPSRTIWRCRVSRIASDCQHRMRMQMKPALQGAHAGCNCA